VTVGAAGTVRAPRILVIVVDAMQVITAVCALLAGAGAVLLVIARLVASRVPFAARVGGAAVAARNTLTLVVAGGSMLGSLYFSEVADYIPCRLCWFQRIAMYPIAVVALVAVLRRDRNARWYTVPMAGVGICISTWHYLLEWNPTWEGESCGLFGPACSVPWFRTFDFVSLALMALCAFAFIIVVNVVSFGHSAEGATAREETP
jgi:disulfide bond formation protein DsbB